jgi:hypothetical protein
LPVPELRRRYLEVDAEKSDEGLWALQRATTEGRLVLPR